ncbi:hypothetical protein [Nonomuraea ceibae]|uniref:hypothetical protein n=1 Tax=Nonomuraea ceibae TaxID=1935170 RepID=UPI001C5D42C7|nr:hypothetical protein [Nonomuraea ceibae]
MTTDLEQLTRLLRAHDPAQHVQARPGDLTATLDAILGDSASAAATPRRRWIRRRWLALAPVAAVLVGLATALPVLLQPQEVGPFVVGPAKALAFAENGDYINVRIVDPDADPRRFREDFAAHGLNVTLTMKPASPSLVGTLVSVSAPQRRVTFHPDGFTIDGEPDDNRIKLIEGADCSRRWCQAGVSIPADLRSPFELVFGRPARPGERYEITGDPVARGEVLEGAEPANHTVAEVKALLRERGAIVESYHQAPPEPRPRDGAGWDFSAHVLRPESVPDDWYVHEVFGGHAPNTVGLVVAPRPTANPH